MELSESSVRKTLFKHASKPPLSFPTILSLRLSSPNSSNHSLPPSLSSTNQSLAVRFKSALFLCCHHSCHFKNSQPTSTLSPPASSYRPSSSGSSTKKFPRLAASCILPLPVSRPRGNIFFRRKLLIPRSIHLADLLPRV